MQLSGARLIDIEIAKYHVIVLLPAAMVVYAFMAEKAIVRLDGAWS